MALKTSAARRSASAGRCIRNAKAARSTASSFVLDDFGPERTGGRFDMGLYEPNSATPGVKARGSRNKSNRIYGVPNAPGNRRVRLAVLRI